MTKSIKRAFYRLSVLAVFIVAPFIWGFAFAWEFSIGAYSAAREAHKETSEALPFPALYRDGFAAFKKGSRV